VQVIAGTFQVRASVVRTCIGEQHEP